MATTQTFDPKYVSGYGDLLKTTTDPNLLSKLTKYGQVTDVYGNPLFDQNVYTAVNSPNTQISNAASKAIDSTLSTWADDVLQKDTLDPLTGKPINWELSGGIGGAQYKAARTNLMANPTNNVRWTAQKTQAQTIADNAVAAAKTVADAKIANDLKIKADADAKITADAKAVADAKAEADQKVIDDKAKLDAANAATLADTQSLAAQKTALENANAPITPKDLGVALDTKGVPIVSTPNITQTMVGDSLKGVPTNVKYDAAGKPIITTPAYTTLDTGMLSKVTADKVTPVTVDRTGTQSAADIAKLVDAAKSVDVNVTPESLVSNRLSGLLAKNNPYIQQAVNSANLQASRRGMLNTGAAAGFAQDAAIKAALPIAQADALTIAKANEANAAAKNALINAGLDLKSKGLISDSGNNVTLNTTQAKLDFDASQYDVANKLDADKLNAQEFNKVLVSNNATLNEAQKDAFKMWGEMAQADTLAQSNTYRIAVQAQYDALAQGAKDANLLNQAFVTGNINLGIAMAKSLSDAAIAERKVATDKAAATQLAADNAAAAKALAEETRITKIADAEIAKAAEKVKTETEFTLESLKNDNKIMEQARQFIANQEADKNSFREKVMVMPDVKKEAQATMINTNNLMVDNATLSRLKGWGVQTELENSDAAKTSTALLTA
jgi:hypothetical protein